MIRPEADSLAHDPERKEAERLAVELGADSGDVAAMDDDQLRRELFHRKRTRRETSDAQRWALGQLSAALGLCGDELGDRLTELGISVAGDGLLEIDRITEEVTRAIGELPVALYHHTSTALLPSIARDGLRIGKQTNFFNTQAGVYVSTMRAGQPVSVYSARAARVHGGEPAVLRVRRRLSQVVPDPDDSDLGWAQGRQYITRGVPPEDLLLEDDTWPGDTGCKEEIEASFFR